MPETQDRNITILETLLFAIPEITLREALDNLNAINEAVENRLTEKVTKLRSHVLPGVAKIMSFIDGSEHIQSFILDIGSGGGSSYKIQAIKEVRAATGCSLRDAKDAVEAWAAEIPTTTTTV